jgi:hypothetical protein
MWAVVMIREGKQPVVWGPMAGDAAAEFAAFATAEIDPAFAVPLTDPVAELTGWREAIAGPAFARVAEFEQACSHPGPEGSVAALAAILAKSYPADPS